MNNNYESLHLPYVKEQPLLSIFKLNKSVLENSKIIQVIDNLLTYNPQSRFTALEAMGHDVFACFLKNNNTILPKLIMPYEDEKNISFFPKLFDFDEQGKNNFIRKKSTPL